MILAWMLYTIAIGMLVAGAALALDHLAAIWSLPRRPLWFAALVAAVVLPIALFFRPKPAPLAQPEFIEFKIPASTQRVRRQQTTQVMPAIPMQLASASRFSWRGKPEWDSPAKAGWALATLILLVVAGRGVWTTMRRRESWLPAQLDGVPVLVAEDSGPAVVGAFDPDIVVPQWAFSLSPSERELMLRHEAEHIAAKDPLALAIAGVTLLLFPWNAPLWFIARRLRLAIEIDCDARVLRQIDQPREYGMLLIAVSARHGTSLSMAASLAERRPLLERRILAMTMRRPSRPMIASVPFIAIAAAAAVAVAQTPQPPRETAPALVNVSDKPVRAERAPKAPELVAVRKMEAPALEAPRVERADRAERATVLLREGREADYRLSTRSCCEISEDTIAVWMARYHSDVVTGATNAETVVFVVDNDGRYVTSRVRIRSDEATARMKREQEAVTARMNVTLDGKTVMTVPGEKVSVAEMAVVADKEMVARRAQEMREAKVMLATTADDVAKLKEKLATMQADDPNLVEKLKARAELVRVKPAVENDVLQDLNVPADAIAAVNVIKKPEGRFAPGPIGVITVFLKKS
jgi:hypothetical protein